MTQTTALRTTATPDSTKEPSPGDIHAEGALTIDGVSTLTGAIAAPGGVTGPLSGLVTPPAVMADGLQQVLLARATWDFAVDGGAVGAIDLGVTLPDNAIVLDGVVDVITTLTSAGDIATIALHAEAADDIVLAVAIGTGTPWDLGLRAIIPLGTSATAFKLTAARAITATIAVEAVTAGKFILLVRYVISE